MIVYVERDASNAIVGVFANAQPGYATEAIDDSDAGVVAFFASLTAGPAITALRSAAGQVLLAGRAVDHIANRAADMAGWTYGRNNLAEGIWAIINLICQRANIAVPTEAEIEAEIVSLRGGQDPQNTGVTAAMVANQCIRRMMQNEIVNSIGAILQAGVADPIGG